MALAWRTADPGDAPRFFAEEYTCSQVLFNLGVVAFLVNLLAGMALLLPACGNLHLLRMATRSTLTFGATTREIRVLGRVLMALWAVRDARASMALLCHHVCHVLALRTEA